jgi:putative selenate reductase
MPDAMRTQPLDLQLQWMLSELESQGSLFGLHRTLFYHPQAGAPFASEMFGQHLATPIGPAAGPHTQLTQNIIAAWLSGGRFIELKTVQIMDELEIPRPCIDMEDEGYNVEWSQELRLDQSAWEYIKAWVLLHILRRVLGWENTPFGTILNMSVGYNLEGMASRRCSVSWTVWRMLRQEIGEIQAMLRPSFHNSPTSRFPPPHQQRHPVDHARLPTRRDRGHRPLPARGARSAHLCQAESHTPGQGCRPGDPP